MSRPTIARLHRLPSASKLVDAIAVSLTEIKAADGHTDAEIGAFLGKGADQGAKYRTGLAEMSVTSFLRGCHIWNGRFANDALAEIGMKLVPLDSGETVGRATASCLTKLLLQVSIALEDGEITDAELLTMRKELDEAGRAIDAMRERLGPRAA